MEKGRLKIYAHLSALISFLLPHIFSFWGEGGGGLDNTSNLQISINQILKCCDDAHRGGKNKFLSRGFFFQVYWRTPSADDSADRDCSCTVDQSLLNGLFCSLLSRVYIIYHHLFSNGILKSYFSIVRSS